MRQQRNDMLNTLRDSLRSGRVMFEYLVSNLDDIAASAPEIPDPHEAFSPLLNKAKVSAISSSVAKSPASASVTARRISS